MSRAALPGVLVLVLSLTPVFAAETEEVFVPLFNGKDLAGWHPVNVHPITFTVRDGMIISTGVPTGVMRTDKQYENFILELEYRHMKPQGNAGLFVWSFPLTAPGQPFTRSIEVQILDGRNSDNYTSHGDIFSIHGASMKPDRPHPAGWPRSLPIERRAKPAGEWNHYRVTANNGTIKLAVNGKEVSGGSQCVPRKGYICLEAEGSECHFRNIRIKELPSTGAKPEETAPLAEDYRPLYRGLDLDAFKAGEAHKQVWTPKDWILDCAGKGAGEAQRLNSKAEYGDIELVVDYKLPASVQRLAVAAETPLAYVAVRDAATGRIPITMKGAGQWHRVVITIRQGRMNATIDGQGVVENADASALPATGPVTLEHAGHPIQFANIFVKELK
jgi:hypothetical protein